ncbi:MAG: PQQ-binding-like beta-propeller repeat protein [Bryobacteraceae bacterium]
MKRLHSVLAIGLGTALAAGRIWAQTPGPDGSALFKSKCASCHDGAENSRSPAPEVMRAKSPESVIDSLVNGLMRVQGSRLSGPERRAIAEFLTGKKLGGDVTGANIGRCEVRPAMKNPADRPLWNGWGADTANTHFQPVSQAGLTADQVPKLKLKWALGFPDATSAWAQPSVASGRVFVGSQNGTVYSVDAKTGCIYWTFSAQGGVRTAITIGPGTNNNFVAYFADTNAHLYAVDASTGEKLWVRKIEEHQLARITGAPTLYNGRIYVGVSSYEETFGAKADYECCTFRGSLSAVDAKTGEVIWKTYTIAAEPKPRGKSASGLTLYGPSGAAIWSSPTIDGKRGVVYAATGNTYSDPDQPTSDAVIAFDLATGKIKWSHQATPKDTFLIGCRPGSTNPNCPEKNGPDYDFGNSPVLAKLPSGKDAIVIGQKSGVAYALDPDKEGAVLWEYRAGLGGALGGMEWGSAVDGENAYFPLSDITRPKPGGLHAVSLATGQPVWVAPPAKLICGAGRGCNAAQSAAITVIPGIVFSASNDGGIRAFSTKDGTVVWQFDTNKDFKTVNGISAKGGSIQAAAPTVAGGMLYLNSGYGAFGGRAGNVLLAFGLE